MLARYMLSSPVRLSVRSRYCVETPKISPRQVDRVVNNTRRRRRRRLRSSLLTTPIRQSTLFTTSRSTVTFELHYCDLLWICCITCFDSWQNFDWHCASRGPSAWRAMSVEILSVCGSEFFSPFSAIKWWYEQPWNSTTWMTQFSPQEVCTPWGKKRTVFFCVHLFNTWQKLVKFFMYIKERISYNSVCLMLACVKNFAE